MAEKRLDIILRARDQASRVFGTVGKSVNGLVKKLTSLPVAIGGLVGGVGLFRFTKSAVTAFGIQEKAVDNLRQALIDAGDVGASSLGGLTDFAAALQEVTTQGDEATISTAAYLAGIGGLTGGPLKEATKATLGLARATNQGQEIMARALLNALQGNFQMLERYIPALRSTTDATDKMALVQDLASKGLNQLTTDARGTDGTFKQLLNTYGDVKEVIGSALEPIIRSLTQAIRRSLPVVQEYSLNFVAGIKSVVEWMGRLRVRFSTEMTAIGVVMDNFTISLKLGALVWAKVALDAFDKINNGIQNLGAFLGHTSAQMFENVKTMFGNIPIIARNAFDDVEKLLRELRDTWNTIWSDMGTVISNTFENAITAANRASDAVNKGSFSPLFNNPGEPFRNIFSGTEGLAKQIRNIAGILLRGTANPVGAGEFVPIPQTQSQLSISVDQQIKALKKLIDDAVKNVLGPVDGVGGVPGGANTIGGLAGLIGDIVSKGTAGAPGSLDALKITNRFFGLADSFRQSLDPAKQTADNTKNLVEESRQANGLLRRIDNTLSRRSTATAASAGVELVLG